MKENIYLSNAFDSLVACLKARLFDRSTHPFSQKKVVVANRVMKNTLMLSLAKDPSLNVVAGVEFLTLSQALRTIQEKKIPNSLELTLLIKNELHSCQDESLLNYLAPDEDNRALALAEQLSFLFTRYGIYGGKELESWIAVEGFQQKLWLSLFADSSPWSYPIQELEKAKQIKGTFHFFGFSFLPKAYFTAFERGGACFYFLSPCQYFWGDLLLEDEESNHLLVHLGKAGRKLAELFEESSTTCECYVEREGNGLQSLQMSMLHLHSVPAFDDDSLQLHAASSKLREIEVLFKHVCHFLKSYDPNEIKVLAPNMDEYFPYIHLVFGEKIPYEIYDCHSNTEKGFLKGLIHLLALPEHRFEKWEVLKLFQFPSFLEKWNIEKKDLPLIETWVHEGRILWGIDRENRQHYLEEQLLEKGETGTWMGGLKQLFEDCVTASTEQTSLEFGDLELFGKVTSLIKSFKETLSPLLQGQWQLFEWVKKIKDLTDMYFLISEEGNSFLQELTRLSAIKVSLSYKNFKKIVHRFSAEQKSFHSSEVHTIQFGSIASFSNIPSKVTFLVGMQEGAFPRAEVRSSFASLKMDNALTKTDEDRAHFIEILLSTRESLIMSYVNCDEKDGKKRDVSPVVASLKLQVTDHPLTKENRQEIPLFIRDLNNNTQDFEEVIDLKHLSLLAKHPIQFYFNRALHLYFERTETSDPEFTLSHLNRAILRQSAMHGSLDQLKFKEKKRFPEGIFTDLALTRVQRETEEFVLDLEKMGISPKEIYSIELKLGCNEIWNTVHPPLKIPVEEGNEVMVVGKLGNITSKGMIFQGTNQLKDLVKIWPLYLVYLCLFPRGELICVKNQKRVAAIDDAHKQLAHYLSYYRRAQTQLSPLMPEWVSSLLKGDREELEKAIHSSFHASFFPDPYLEWLAARDSLPQAEPLMEVWAPLVKEIYAFV